jgi:hypothetical protein
VALENNDLRERKELYKRGLRILLENHEVKKYERKVTPIERFFTRSPYSIVTMVARIKGSISESILRNAVSKVQGRHLNLRVRIIEYVEDNIDIGTMKKIKEGAMEAILGE